MKLIKGLTWEALWKGKAKKTNSPHTGQDKGCITCGLFCYII